MDTPNHPDHLLADLLALVPETPTGLDLHDLPVTHLGQPLTPAQQMIVQELRDQASERLAHAVLERPDVRAMLGPVSGDVTDIAMALIPLLRDSFDAGSIPRVPVLVASLARRIAQMETEEQEPG